MDNKHVEELENKILEGEKAESQFEFFGALICYKEALQLAQKNSKSDKVKMLKAKVIEVGKKIDYSSLAFEEQIPISALDEFVDSVVREEDSLPLILKNVGLHPYLYPNLSQSLERARRTMPVTYHIVDLTTVSPDGHVIEGGSDPVLAWNAQTYGMNQDFISNLYLQRVFDALKTKKGLTDETLFSYIDSQKTFSPRSLPFIKIGLQKYFENDYVSALHILVPQFESSFLTLSEKLGIDIIALNRGSEVSTRTKVLSDNHLISSEFRNKWGENFCEQIKFALFDPLGGKLRHKIAHGEINLSECTKINAELIIYFFLVLSGRVEVKRKEKTE